MQGTYNYIPETFHVSKICSVASFQYVQFMLHVILFPSLNVLYFDIRTFRSMYGVSNVVVLCYYYYYYYLDSLIISIET
jgi:hypothetical protein